LVLCSHQPENTAKNDSTINLQSNNAFFISVSLIEQTAKPELLDGQLLSDNIKTFYQNDNGKPVLTRLVALFVGKIRRQNIYLIKINIGSL